MRPSQKLRSGFTLVELSISIVIISLLAGAALMFGSQQIEIAREIQTREKLSAITEALLAYRRVNNRLPCPASFTLQSSDTDFGTELYGSGSIGDGDCDDSTVLPGTAGGGAVDKGRWGVVPVRTLGLPDSFMFDGWGNRIDYAVDSRITAFNAFSAWAIDINTIGSMIMRDIANNDITGNALYVLVSHGKNGHGAYNRIGTRIVTHSVNTSELSNCNCDASGNEASLDNVFFLQDYYVNPSNGLDVYDDILTYKLRSQMRSSSE